ncbi:hypothetical protein K2173_002902 [Erythroxylum novogranatense]|uniref:PLAC8 family protein n=1 Tax=Erythroxylum novogranatense TaxID=1862640 RepID=A0AAV8TR86_9ROSI|nr:hypothetical protein K2173_002902 [Erythroxylum novogranatense]
MDSITDVNQKDDIEESNGIKSHGQVPLAISASRRTLLSYGIPHKKFQDSLTALPNRMKFLKIGSASTKFKQLARERDEISRSVASSDHGLRDRINGVLARKMDWTLLVKMSKEWLKNPMNIALFVWILCVAVSGAILFLVMTGMLNKALPKKSQRNAWFEVNNQILNALFTLMCLYQHPKRLYHLVLLCRWEPEDISKLRRIYCKNGTYKPHEWAHMMVVVILLQINCFAQYALCGLNLGYKRSERPAIGVGICISFAIAAPAVAGVYSVVSPLGKEYDSEVDEELAIQPTSDESKRPQQLRVLSLERRYSFATRDDQSLDEARPQWSGGVLDFWDDISLAYLSLFCSFCVFGWNMDRLGFGNMYVHIATFLLFCMAPFWIFNLAAINIDNEAAREALGLAGIILCAFGLLYGGFWRIQMRKRFNLPAYTFCFGQPSASDCTLWLCCCWCSLAQEVRTGNSYDVVADCRKQMDDCCEVVKDSNSPLGSNSSPHNIQTGNSPSHRPTCLGFANPHSQVLTVKDKMYAGGHDEITTPPTPPSIEREAI